MFCSVLTVSFVPSSFVIFPSSVKFIASCGGGETKGIEAKAAGKSRLQASSIEEVCRHLRARTGLALRNTNSADYTAEIEKLPDASPENQGVHQTCTRPLTLASEADR